MAYGHWNLAALRAHLAFGVAAPVKLGSCQTSVLLTGGTGQVGLFALPRLLAAAYPVIACSRRISSGVSKKGGPGLSHLHWVHPDTILESSGRNGAKEGMGILQDVAVLLSCGPLELAAQLAPLCPRLQRVVCISTSSVYTKLTSPDASERRLIAAIKASEDTLKQYCKARDIVLVLLRPTLIYGCGLDHNVSRIARLAKRFHFIPVAGKASGLRQPVHAEDLAKLVLSVIEATDVSSVECPVGGGSVLSYRELVERIFTGLGLSPRIVQIPSPVLAVSVRALSWLPFMGGLNAEFIVRQNLDLVFDDSRLRMQFGYDPRPFEPTPGDFTIPQVARALQPN